jgi:hypothetical protein
MTKLLSVCGAIAVAATTSASAEDFPLTFRTIPDKDVMSFPGASGNSAPLQQAKPTKLKKEPKTMSRHPLYGECRDASTGAALVFRLDESKGDGRGYDQLILDMNQNGDLTDDPVAQRAVLPGERQSGAIAQFLFGPIQAPADKSVAGGRPTYFAQGYIYNRQLLGSGRDTPNLSFGRLVLKPGWYLDTTVELNGLKQKVGVTDGNSNLRLGDVTQPQIMTMTSAMTSGGEKTWYFQPGDCLLMDADGSGSFENDVFQSEACPFGPILYLGGKAYKVALTPDCKSLRVEPWTEPLAEVALLPHGNPVKNLTLAWEGPSGNWQQIRPAVNDGKVMVPPGNYRLYACSLSGGRAPRDQVMVSGMQRVPQTPVSIAVGKANTLECGGPIQVKVTATKGRAGTGGVLIEDSSNARANSEPMLRINASLAGAGGEVYTTFLKGDRFQSRPPKPTFSIVQAGGKTVATGNLEYG